MADASIPSKRPVLAALGHHYDQANLLEQLGRDGWHQ